MTDIADWYNRIPFFTKWWLSLTIGFSIAGRFGMLDPRYMILWSQPIFHDFQIWRPITALFYYPVNPKTGFHFLVNCYFLYHYNLRLEKEEFNGRPADHFFMLLINWISCTLIALAIELTLLMDCMVLSVLYVWCQLNKDVIVQFWFGTMFKAMYLPWVLFGFNFIISGGGVSELIGILAGHAYYFLKFTYPQEYGTQSFLTTPNFLYKIFPSRTSAAGFGVPPPRNTAPTNQQSSFGGHNWGGRGRILRDEVD